MEFLFWTPPSRSKKVYTRTAFFGRKVGKREGYLQVGLAVIVPFSSLPTPKDVLRLRSRAFQVRCLHHLGRPTLTQTAQADLDQDWARRWRPRVEGGTEGWGVRKRGTKSFAFFFFSLFLLLPRFLFFLRKHGRVSFRLDEIRKMNRVVYTNIMTDTFRHHTISKIFIKSEC